jgi:hypothetical protein
MIFHGLSMLAKRSLSAALSDASRFARRWSSISNLKFEIKVERTERMDMDLPSAGAEASAHV